MNTARKGLRGREVRFLQLALNTHIQRRPMLRVDGVFGVETEKRVQEFQKFAGLTIDGIVGLQTWRALLAPAKLPAPNLSKFRAQLRPAADFVEYLRGLERTKSDTTAVLEAASDFTGTATGGRYLLTKEQPGVIDFRHFFAAASETYSASRSRKANSPIGGGRGNTLLLGVANELGQCVDEMLRMKLNSCFSPEDLGSNRLGAEFGRSLLISGAGGTRQPVHEQLRTFLARTAPQPPKAIGDTVLPGFWGVAAESTAAIAIGILDALLPEAY